MALSGYIALLISLGVLVASDFRRRTVTVGWVAVFGCLCVAAALWQYGWRTVLVQSGQNLLLLAYLAGGVSLYFRVRRRKWINPLGAYVGTGDLVFLLCLTPLFNVRSYLIFLLVSMSATLAGWGVYYVATKRRENIPLVGTIGVVLGCYLLFHVFCP